MQKIKTKPTCATFADAENYKILELEEPLETVKSRPLISQGVKLKYK